MNLTNTINTINTGLDVQVLSKGKLVIIRTVDSVVVVSYGKNVVYRDNRTGKIYIDITCYDYSTTTLRHVGAYLGEGKDQIDAKLASGEYGAASLNCGDTAKRRFSDEYDADIGSIGRVPATLAA